VLIALEGWTERAEGWNFSLLKEELENLSIKIVVPRYLDTKGKFSKIRSHCTVEQYAAKVEAAILREKQKDPNAKIYVLGHSLGGLIARYLCNRKFFPEERMILAGTPNLGVDFGPLKNLFFMILAKIFNVPVFFQIIKGSNFIYSINLNGIPEKAIYISGQEDKVVSRDSSDPLKKGIIIPNCGHKLFPREKEKLENSAIPYVRKILEKDLENK
jgi:hypothetical protein